LKRDPHAGSPKAGNTRGVTRGCPAWGAHRGDSLMMVPPEGSREVPQTFVPRGRFPTVLPKWGSLKLLQRGIPKGFTWGSAIGGSTFGGLPEGVLLRGSPKVGSQVGSPKGVAKRGFPKGVPQRVSAKGPPPGGSPSWGPKGVPQWVSTNFSPQRVSPKGVHQHPFPKGLHKGSSPKGVPPGSVTHRFLTWGFPIVGSPTGGTQLRYPRVCPSAGVTNWGPLGGFTQ
jgi:hypothetical protein